MPMLESRGDAGTIGVSGAFDQMNGWWRSTYCCQRSTLERIDKMLGTGRGVGSEPIYHLSAGGQHTQLGQHGRLII